MTRTEEDIQEQLRKEYPMDSDSDSELSDPPEHEDEYEHEHEHAQSQTEARQDKGKAPLRRLSNNHSHTTTDPPSSKPQPIIPHSTHAHPTPSTPSTPRPNRRLSAFEMNNALALTTTQSLEFLQFFNRGMTLRGLLGTLNYTRLTIEESTALEGLYAGAKAELPFLTANGLSEEELNHVLYERAKLSNRNEKHNWRMVRAGRVKRRAGMEGLEKVVEGESSLSASSGSGTSGLRGPSVRRVQHMPVLDHTPNAGRRASAPGILTDSLDAGTSFQYPESEANGPGSAIKVDQQDGGEKKVATLNPVEEHCDVDIFIVKGDGSNDGVALHRMELIRASGTFVKVLGNKGKATIGDLRFFALVALINERLGGGDVRFQLDADVSGFRVALHNAESWVTVLEAWQNTGRKTARLYVRKEASKK